MNPAHPLQRCESSSANKGNSMAEMEDDFTISVCC
jgi:hypothetical protein